MFRDLMSAEHTYGSCKYMIVIACIEFGRLKRWLVSYTVW